MATKKRTPAGAAGNPEIEINPLCNELRAERTVMLERERVAIGEQASAEIEALSQVLMQAAYSTICENTDDLARSIAARLYQLNLVVAGVLGGEKHSTTKELLASLYGDPRLVPEGASHAEEASHG